MSRRHWRWASWAGLAIVVLGIAVGSGPVVYVGGAVSIVCGIRVAVR